MPNYPAQIDTTQSLPTAIDNLTPVYGAIFNRLRDVVLAIENELGVKPSGSYGTVAARLITLENTVGNLQIIQLSGDLGGTLEKPLIIGIQGRPVSTRPPTFGDVLVWNGIAWNPEQGSGGFNPPPGVTPGQTLIWDGAIYSAAFYQSDDLLPPLLVSLAGTNLVEVGQSLTHPSFTGTYTQVPVLASLEDSDNLTLQDITTTPSAFSSNYSFTKNTFGAHVTFTLTATEGHTTKSSKVTTTWAQKLYWGTGIAGQSGASFITSLSNSQITTNKLFSFSIAPGPSQYIYFACRTAYAPITFTVNGIQGGLSVVGTYSVTNGHGFSENYNLYVSDFANLGSCLVFVGDGNDEFRLLDFGMASSGTTAQRPSSPSYYLAIGARFFDTSLGIPIWWNGVNWINAAGIVV